MTAIKRGQICFTREKIHATVIYFYGFWFNVCSPIEFYGPSVMSALFFVEAAILQPPPKKKLYLYYGEK